MNFKSNLFVILIIICLLFSISCVSASDNSTNIINADDNYQTNAEFNQLESVNQDNLANGDDYKSFDEFHQDAMNSSGTFNVKSDYKYDENDRYESLRFTIESLVINGNNHVIDGSGSDSVFTFYFNNSTGADFLNLTVNDLTFKHFNSQCIAVSNAHITLNNVTFIDCNSELGFVFISDQSVLCLNNTNFSSRSNCSFIFSDHSDIIINNSYLSGKDDCANAITQDRGQLIIENTIFENFNSENGAIINFKGDYFSIRNSKLINSRSQFNGGAIIAKYFPLYDYSFEPYPSDAMLIENCVFSNLSASNDGGAIYIDLDSGSEHIPQSLNIVNSNFTNCTSRYGGAIAIQGGSLNIMCSNLINNSAAIKGGAIFSSWCSVNIANSTLSNNMAEKNAGAIYFDKGKLAIRYSNITNNKALNGSDKAANAIYANDVDAYFANSTFDNGGIGVYANFASNSKMENVVKDNDAFLLDNKDYVVSVETKAIKFNLTNNSIVVDKLPSRFDARDWGWTTPGKIQGDNDDCWAFATVASLETALLKSTGQAFNLSQNYVQKLNLKYYPMGDLRISLTGFAYNGLGYALNWIGALPSDRAYDDRGMLVDTDLDAERIHVQDALIIFDGANNADLIKQAVLKYGAVTVQVIYNNLSGSINATGEDIAVMDHGIHFVSIIGWDDNYGMDSDNSSDESMDDEDYNDSADYDVDYNESMDYDDFMDGDYSMDNEEDADQDTYGAWITKDSLVGFYEIFYSDWQLLAIDYYAIVPQNPAIAYIFENTIDYHVNYQTDLTGLTGFDENYTYYSNEFTSKYSELIGAVGTYFNESGIDYSFDIYVNNNKVHSQSGVSEFAGFRTIVLNKYIPVKAGDKFKVVFKNNNLPYQAYSRVHYISGMSKVSADGKSWTDMAPLNKTVCLKAYTVKDDSKIINNKAISVDYAGGKYFSVKVVTADGHSVGAGASVKFTINGKTTTVKTDTNGIAKIKITQKPGKYTIKITYNGKTYSNKVTVKQVLTASKVTVKKTYKKFTLKAKLKINGKLVKGKTITFKFNGKTYKVKTNSKGIAQKVLKKSVIKKLKKGKTYFVKVIYLKDTIKTTVKVK